MNETKSRFSEKNQQNWPTFIYINLEKKKKRRLTWLNQKWKTDITTNLTEIDSLLRAYCDQLCAKNFNNLNEMDKF